MPPCLWERSEAISIRWPWRLLRFANKEIAPFALSPPLVMAALVAAIHVFRTAGEDVDGRDRPGHDERRGVSIQQGRPPDRCGTRNDRGGRLRVNLKQSCSNALHRRGQNA